MDEWWFANLFTDVGSVAHIALIIGLVAAFGLALGSIRVWGLSLGIGGVLFAGLFFGHVGQQGLEMTRQRWEQQAQSDNPAVAKRATERLAALPQRLETRRHILEFMREFGLILFVYTIGVQVGPGFIASLRRQGLPLNLMAAAIVILGALTALGLGRLSGMQMPETVGMLAGATTNTPSLAAAQQAIKDRSHAAGQDELTGERQSNATNAYAIAYPFGILGIILAMILIRYATRVDLNREAEALAALTADTHRPVTTMNLEVTNPNLDGLPIRRIPALRETGVTISRVCHGDRIMLACGDTKITLGDVLLAVGYPEDLHQLRMVVGKESEIDLRKLPSEIIAKRIIVTRSAALGKTVAELDLHARFGVTVTRVHRAEVEVPAANARLQFGDTLVVVGEPEGIEEVGRELGNSVKQLNHPQIIPVFIGIILGVIVGSWTVDVGLSAPVKLGLAGGPLVVAIILSRLGHIGPLVWYMPLSANFILREIGIVMFLAAVGFSSGDRFLETLLHGPGFMWMGLAAVVTLLPLLVVGFFARMVYGLNYMTICGLLSGSMTDPPALAFAGSITGSDAPSIAYATVYPLVMLLRVIIAQMLVLMLM